jgi:hypothetical protein
MWPVSLGAGCYNKVLAFATQWVRPVCRSPPLKRYYARTKTSAGSRSAGWFLSAHQAACGPHALGRCYSGINLPALFLVLRRISRVPRPPSCSFAPILDPASADMPHMIAACRCCPEDKNTRDLSGMICYFVARFHGYFLLAIYASCRLLRTTTQDSLLVIMLVLPSGV